MEIDNVGSYTSWATAQERLRCAWLPPCLAKILEEAMVGALDWAMYVNRHIWLAYLEHVASYEVLCSSVLP